MGKAEHHGTDTGRAKLLTFITAAGVRLERKKERQTEIKEGRTEGRGKKRERARNTD